MFVARIFCRLRNLWAIYSHCGECVWNEKNVCIKNLNCLIRNFFSSEITLLQRLFFVVPKQQQFKGPICNICQVCKYYLKSKLKKTKYDCVYGAFL